jgi:transcriptional regulator with XRE-family HTH domain
MKKKAVKLYEEEGTKYQFDSEKFKVLINQKKLSLNKAHKKTTKAEIMESIAEDMCVSTEAIKNWMYGYNGPSDLEQVKKIGDFFETDYHYLLIKEATIMNTTVTTSTMDGSAQALYTRESVRKLFAAFLKFVNRGTYYQDQIVEAKGFYDDEMISGEKVPCLMHSAMDEMLTILDEIRELLYENLLEIPEGFYNRLFNYVSEKQDDLLGYYHFNYSAADEEEGTKEELWIYEEGYQAACDYFFEKGIDELRELFKEYVVK